MFLKLKKISQLNQFTTVYYKSTRLAKGLKKTALLELVQHFSH